ncbi:hypothetical protein CAEBREN_31644 [Caenorhabditis brenneri]|uniref:Uncharacterized protein n=1 Tax=Caenorhabditis brenneri TaxID=135651 RepID=G0NCD4_CAEBE|nr:hypothetical protein CAEBREN_31644 [Caenorhabditis brenneri]
MAPVPVDLTKIDFKQLLRRNVSGDGNFMGMRYQRGSAQRGAGLGGVLGVAMGLLPKFMSSTAGRQLINAGKEVVQEMAQGKDVASSIKSVAKQKMKQLSGGGARRRRIGRGARKSIKGDSVSVIKPHLVSDSRVNFLST